MEHCGECGGTLIEALRSREMVQVHNYIQFGPCRGSEPARVVKKNGEELNLFKVFSKVSLCRSGSP